VEQEVLILSGVPEFTPFFNGVDVAQSVVFCVLFCISLFVFCLLSFGHGIVCPSSIYGFPLPLWYYQGFLESVVLQSF
jgi:hypothetical protein